ncbi:MAG: S41 family peptidase, partial [Gammaproteobacteria bacterium]
MAGSRRSFVTFPVVIFVCALMGGLYGQYVRATTRSNEGDIQQSLQTLAKVYAAVEENYADPVNPEKAIYNGAIQGMLRTLDP